LVLDAAQLQLRRAPAPSAVGVRISVPEQVQAGGRPELDEVDRLGSALAGELEEGGQKRVAALHLVRLHRLLAHEAGEEPTLRLERRAEVRPVAGERIRLDARELEVVHAAEETQRQVPAQVVDEVVDERLGCAAARQARVDRRALLLEMLRLVAEDRLP